MGFRPTRRWRQTRVLPLGQAHACVVRLDGTDFDLFGYQGRLRTKVCWSRPPFARFTCPETLHGVRLDGSVAFYYGTRLFVIAREHLRGPRIRKRTALYEITGNLEGGSVGIRKWGEFPSAGDTSYAGVVALGSGRFLVSWYSSPREAIRAGFKDFPAPPTSGKRRSTSHVSAAAPLRAPNASIDSPNTRPGWVVSPAR